MLRYLVCFTTCLLVPITTFADEHRVNSSDALNELFEAGELTAGDEIIWENGSYLDQEIELNGVDGTQDAPIIFRAEKPGGVVFLGESQIRTNAKWWVIEGFHFDYKDGVASAYNPIQFRGAGDVGAEHVRLTNCGFTSLDNGEETSKWVQIYGRFNQVDHCHFSGKPNKGAVLTVELKNLDADQSAEHLIQWNYFADISRKEGNDNETIRVGFSGDQDKPARCTIAHNLFYRCNGENEIISNKSSHNRYTANTFRQCNGSLVLRHGHHATVDGNHFFGQGADDAGGIRVNDSHHRIYNNYMQNLTGTSWNAALSIEGGKQPSGGDSNGYQAVDNVSIVHNSIINCTKSFFLNSKHGGRAPTGVIANNIFRVASNRDTLVDAKLETDELKWSSNLFYGAELAREIPGIRRDPLLESTNGRFSISQTSPAIDSASGNFDFVQSDIDNLPRPDSGKDIGAHEFSIDVTRKPTELNRNQVGTTFLDRSEITANGQQQDQQIDEQQSEQEPEQSVKPGINKKFIDPNMDVDAFVKRFEVESREIVVARERILAACEIEAGDRVADIGAGTGLFSRMFSTVVGDEGWVYSVDISPRFLEHINKESTKNQIRNITGVLCAENSCNLPPLSVDVVFICDTYHHFEFPKSTLATIHRALKPGGHIILVDFERIEGKTRRWLMGHVRAGKEVFSAEIEAAGFSLETEKQIDGLKENYLLKFVKE